MYDKEMPQEDMRIKDWKIRQIAAENNGGYPEEILAVEKETEKAVLLLIEWSWCGTAGKRLRAWVPKSAVYSAAEEERERAARIDAGVERYERLLGFAKAHAVKGARRGLRAATILAKVRAAGLEYEY